MDGARPALPGMPRLNCHHRCPASLRPTRLDALSKIAQLRTRTLAVLFDSMKKPHEAPRDQASNRSWWNGSPDIGIQNASVLASLHSYSGLAWGH